LGIPFLLLAQDEASYHPLGEWSPVTSQFGYRDDPIYGGRTEAFHKGIDLDCELGDSVYAWREGIVTFTGYNKLSGNMIDISHSNGYVSKYHHLYRIYVEKGETIAAGQVIGKAGRSGKVTGAHLHFTIMKDGKYKNPLPFLKKAQTVPQSVSLVSSPDVQINKFFTIKSIPVSGKVYIDDTYYGTTPLTVELPYGKHTVEIDAGRGYQNYKEEILVDQDFDYLFSARLEIQPATPVAQADDNQPLADTHPAEVQINKT
ncbi:MAG: peptidoglycan DD-metalloendopeptidase family protein, partial [candidate division Zixibacteria bacterium]|nr:peptidoglycan DD-metalloendopeptidase family protein [candidate division Zixibacteria bacterium]NIX54812.1 peptidoglycan DD-metalloendopeptidase family protein [candidate division Zixibacteria bacterium]